MSVDIRLDTCNGGKAMGCVVLAENILQCFLDLCYLGF
jgi:hypothetical protein